MIIVSDVLVEKFHIITWNFSTRILSLSLTHTHTQKDLKRTMGR
jgi:hypothetical protein